MACTIDADSIVFAGGFDINAWLASVESSKVGSAHTAALPAMLSSRFAYVHVVIAFANLGNHVT